MPFSLPFLILLCPFWERETRVAHSIQCRRVEFSKLHFLIRKTYISIYFWMIPVHLSGAFIKLSIPILLFSCAGQQVKVHVSICEVSTIAFLSYKHNCSFIWDVLFLCAIDSKGLLHKQAYLLPSAPQSKGIGKRLSTVVLTYEWYKKSLLKTPSFLRSAIFCQFVSWHLLKSSYFQHSPPCPPQRNPQDFCSLL